MRELILVLAILMPSLAMGQHAERRSQLTRNANGTFWTFAEPQPYHDAAVRVSAGSAGGSGTLVGTDGKYTMVVTNHHVVETDGWHCAPVITITMRDGQRLQAKFCLATPNEDVAVYAIPRNDLPCVAISSENPPPGAIIDTMGFGGPLHSRNAFRPFIAPTVPTTKAIAVDAPAISGDSGSGMIWQGVLVGVNWGADAAPVTTAGVADGSGIPLVYPATSSADALFLSRYLTQACGDLGCRPIIGRPGYLIPRGDQKWERQPRFPGPEQFYPQPGQQPVAPTQPITPPVTQPTQPTPVSPPPSEPCSCTDLDTLAQGVLDRLAKDDSLASRLRGPQGPAGIAGQKGDKGDPGEVSQAQLASVVTAVVKSIKEDPNMRGPAGPKGDSGQITPEQIAQIKKEILAEITHPDIRVLIGSRGRIVDDETYKAGEPIVLDIEALVRAASASN